jgi:hypothetical protein
MDNNSQLAKTDATAGEIIPQSLNLSKLNNLKQITFIGKMMAQSGMFSDVNKDPAKAVVKIIAGQEMGIPPVEAMRGLDIIQGEIAIGAGLMAAKIKGSAKYDYKVRQWDDEGCKLEFFERNEETGKLESQGFSEFSRKDATAAGLINKDMYKKFPRNMFFSRAMSNGQSIYCADIFQVGTIYTREELDDKAEPEADGSEPPAAALPAQAAPVPAVADAPDNHTDKEPDESDVADKTVLQMIGEELEAKGFADKLERQKIAFAVGGVKKVSDLSNEQWAGVLENIRELSFDDLAASYIEQGQADKPPVKTARKAMDDGDAEPPESFLAPEDEELDAALADLRDEAKPRYVVPAFSKPSSNLPRPDMQKLFKQWAKDYGITTAPQLAKFIKNAIGKEKLATFDDYIKALETLAAELNQQEALL